MHDVIIVGAGCVGRFAVKILAEKGFDVLVLDKDREVEASVNCSRIIGAEARWSADQTRERRENHGDCGSARAAGGGQHPRGQPPLSYPGVADVRLLHD